MHHQKIGAFFFIKNSKMCIDPLDLPLLIVENHHGINDYLILKLINTYPGFHYRAIKIVKEEYFKRKLSSKSP